MSSAKFIGVYSGNLPQEGVTQAQPKNERQNWYVWLEEKTHTYIMQPLNKVLKPDGQAQRVDAKDFGLYFWENQSHNSHGSTNDDPIMIQKKDGEDSSVRLHEYKKSRTDSAPPSSSPQPTRAKSSVKNVILKKDTVTSDDYPIRKLPPEREPSTKDTPLTNKSSLRNVPPTQERSRKPPTPFDAESIDDFLLDSFPSTLGEFDFDVPTVPGLPGDEVEMARELDILMRDDFTASMDLWKSGKKRQAKELFRDILDQDYEFSALHKHTFTDLSIELRRIKEHPIALAYAIKCFELSPHDSNACFNVARMYFENAQYREAKFHLDMCLDMEDNFPLARQFRAVVQQYIIRYKLWEKK